MRTRRSSLYALALCGVIGAWVTGMSVGQKWHLLATGWPKSLTMFFGSFVSGSTPAGGGSVAFPVFTKALEVPPSEARTFSLMIQSVGMSMAALFIFSRRIRVYRQVLAVTIPAGIIGHAMGTFWIALPHPYPRLLFSMVATMLGASLFVSHWLLRWHPIGIDDHFRFENKSACAHLAAVATLGGVVSSLTGSGVDMLSFVVMALAFGLHEKRAIPTSVVIMAAVSCFGFALRGATGRIEPPVWDYWLACVPVVAVGAPLGAWVAATLGRGALMAGFLVLIAADFTSTLILIQLGKPEVAFMVACALAAALYLTIILRRRAIRLRRRGESGQSRIEVGE